MRLITTCLASLYIGIALGDLPPPERSYKILMLLPASSKSHRNVFMPVAEALADRGHKIVMLTNQKKKGSKHPNIYEVFHGLEHLNSDNLNMFEERKKTLGLAVYKEALPKLARDLYKVPQVKDIYDKRKEFDLIVINSMLNEMVYPFAHEMPYITIATPGMDVRQSAVLGNPIPTSYMPALGGPAEVETVYGRALNTLILVFFSWYWRNWAIAPLIQKEIDQIFPDLPPLLEIERNQSLTLMNSHFSLDMVLPLLPSQVEVGAMHCLPAKPLPEDLKSFIEGAGSPGVIYFSLGSIARGDTMPTEYRDMFVEAFKELNQRVVWKFEADLEGISENVMIRSWLPQQDILAHPNVKVFITHGGLLSTQEASYHGTPMLAIPIYGDQPKNADKITAAGLGLKLHWEELTVDKIVKILKEIINNPQYRAKAAEVSMLVKDQISHPTDRAVFWTEYVIRHKGAPKLRSPAASLTWIEFLLLDVVAVVVVIVICILLIMWWIVKKLFHAVFGSSDKEKKKYE